MFLVESLNKKNDVLINKKQKISKLKFNTKFEHENQKRSGDIYAYQESLFVSLQQKFDISNEKLMNFKQLKYKDFKKYYEKI